MRKADLIGGIVLACASLFLIYFAIPYGTEDGSYFGLSPLVYPTVMAAGMGLCAVGLIVQSIVQANAPSEPAPISPWRLMMFVISISIAVAGVVLIDHFGIWIGGPFLIAAMMIFLGERKPVLIVITSIVPVVLLYLMATYVLKAPLP